MSLGVTFALDPAQTAELLGLEGDEAREAWLQDHEERVEDDDWFEFDKTWDELHRCLGDGELVVQDGPPLAHAVFGSRPLMEDDDAPAFAGHLPAAEVPAVAAALREVDAAWLHERFDRLGRTDYVAYGQPLDDDLFEAMWSSLAGLRDFTARAAERGASLVFSVEG